MSSPQPSSNPRDALPVRIEDLLAAQDSGQAPAQREGLPSSFRMRADSHYVDLLDSPSSAAATPPVGARKPSEEAADPGPSATIELERSLSALGVCANLMGDGVPALARLTAANLIRAEVCRARCLLQALRVWRDEVAVRCVPVAALALVDRVLQSVEPERRLRGLVVDRQLDASACRVAADEELLVSALSGVLLVAFGVVEGAAQPRVTVTTEANAEFVFTVALEGSPLRASPPDSGEGAQVGGAVLLSAARRIVERCNGRFSVTTIGHRTEVRVLLPRLRDQC
jgi:hypothetical protein